MSAKTGGIGVNDLDAGGDPNARIRDFFPNNSTKRKPSGSAVSLVAAPSSSSSNPPPPMNNNNAGAAPAGRGRRVRTIYACAADHGTELSFEANQIIVNVKKSQEPGWLLGTLNGKEGLIPANYVEFLQDVAT